MARKTTAGEISDEERRLRAKSGGYAAVAKYGGKAMTAAARRGRWARFERQVEEADPGLRERDPQEFHRRVNAASKSFMAALAQKAAKARRERRQVNQEAAAAGAPICPECERAWGRKPSPTREQRLCARHAKALRMREARKLNKQGSPEAVTLRQEMAQLQKEWRAMDRAVGRLDAFLETLDLYQAEVRETRLAFVRLEDRVATLERERRGKR